MPKTINIIFDKVSINLELNLELNNLPRVMASKLLNIIPAIQPQIRGIL